MVFCPGWLCTLTGIVLVKNSSCHTWVSERDAVFNQWWYRGAHFVTSYLTDSFPPLTIRHVRASQLLLQACIVVETQCSVEGNHLITNNFEGIEVCIRS